MGVLPVIPDVSRITVNWNRNSGVMPRNVLHLRDISGGVTALSTAWNAAKTAAGAHWWDPLPTAFNFASLDVLPLDGTSPTTSIAVTVAGGQSDPDFSPATAVVLSLKSSIRGPRGRGRVYLGPCSESFISDGILGTTAAANIAAAWNNFANTLQAHDWELGIASYVHSDFHPVVSIRCDTVLGTQKRRQDQLR